MFLIIICIIIIIIIIYQSEQFPHDGSLGPSAGLIYNISYTNYDISNNEHINRYILRPSPEIRFKGQAGKYYTLCMVDLDEPSPNNPSSSEWRHWLVINVPGSDFAKVDSYTGDHISDYRYPDPVTGKHRYVFKLFEQPDLFSIKINDERNNWDSEHFARQLNLKPRGYIRYYAEMDNLRLPVNDILLIFR